MKKLSLKMGAQDFAKSVAWVVKTLDPKDSNAHVDFIVKPGNKGVLSYESQTSYARGDVSFTSTKDMEDVVSIPLDGKYLSKLAGVLSKVSGDIVLTKDISKKSSGVVVSGENGLKFNIPTVVGGTPKSPEVVDVATANEGEFLGAMSRFSRLCDASSSSNVAKSAVAVKFEEDSVVLMATDEFVLGEARIPVATYGDSGCIGETFLVPQEVASRFAPGKDADEEITIVYCASMKSLGYRFTDGRIVLFSLTDATPLRYVDMAKNVCSAADKRVVVDAGEFKRSVGVISQLSWNDPTVYVGVGNGVLTVSDRHKENSLDVSLRVSSDTERVIVFMRNVLSPVLATLTSPVFALDFSMETNGVVFYPMNEQGEETGNSFVLAMTQRDDG